MDEPTITIKIISADQQIVTYIYCIGNDCVGGTVKVGETIDIYRHEIKDV
jgi:hypothetical protein